MKILVISDLHAFTQKRDGKWKPSYFDLNNQGPKSAPQQFKALLKNGEIPEPDLIVTPGDLGDQADRAATDAAWKYLVDLSDLTKQKMLIATTGNHEIDSRYVKTDYDPKGHLVHNLGNYPAQSKTILGPEDSFSLMLHYWALNFYVIELDRVRFIVLNSAAYHGGGNPRNGKEEFLHGRVSDLTINGIKDHFDKNYSKKMIIK